MGQYSSVSRAMSAIQPSADGHERIVTVTLRLAVSVNRSCGIHMQYACCQSVSCLLSDSRFDLYAAPVRLRLSASIMRGVRSSRRMLPCMRALAVCCSSWQNGTMHIQGQMPSPPSSSSGGRPASGMSDGSVASNASAGICTCSRVPQGLSPCYARRCDGWQSANLHSRACRLTAHLILSAEAPCCHSCDTRTSSGGSTCRIGRTVHYDGKVSIIELLIAVSGLSTDSDHRRMVRLSSATAGKKGLIASHMIRNSESSSQPD